jgi:predicted O-linked N-acetylglucosamine transferase (SPINDLY family)
MNMDTLQESSKRKWLESNYLQATQIFEELIQVAPQVISNYWYLGLAYLLQGEEETAQLIWLSTIAEQESEDEVIQSLVQTLSGEAERFTSLQQFREAWIIRRHICEFFPQEPTNLLSLVKLSSELGELEDATVEELGLTELLQSKLVEIEPSLILDVLEKVLQVPAAETLSFAAACFLYIPSQWAEILTTAAADFAFKKRLTNFAIALIQLCLQKEPDNEVALGYLPRFHTECQNYKEAIETAKEFCKRAKTPEVSFFATCVLFQALARRGDWKEIPAVGRKLKEMITDLIQKDSTQLCLNTIRFLIVSSGLFLYLKDDLAENRRFQNQVSQLFLKNIETNAPKSIKPISVNFKQSTERLKIGYIASTFREHSVSWLSRWLFQHHDHESFEIFAYLVCQRPDNDFFELWFANQVDQFRHLGNDIGDSVRIIRDDKIDILIDLDSLTLDQTCTIMALKPAPIQATWLGYDASGLPSIDYFIADHYVLPDNAQDHYQEKILRLPYTYIAVDGFEMGIPTLRRSDLNISENAIVYLSNQFGLKRNPDTVRVQMQILRKVANSYFLVKGVGDQDIIRDFFIQIAKEEGVSPDQLRFLPRTPDEYTHRANIQIADIVLDTYPYNGATTTLETLWAGVPMVTRVGQQFAARNSYAFMMNVGVTEGIAWSDDEYVEWGIKLGQDESLRQQVAWKLKQSRHTSPLWNAKQFTRELETAYRQMYSKFVESQVTASNLLH